MRVAIVHYWFTAPRGGEAVVDALCEIYPDADIFTHVSDPAVTSGRLAGHRITHTFIARLPFARRLYQAYLPLMPLALEQLDLGAYDLVISSESGPAKGVIVRPDALHVCYCHTPMRYLWDAHPDYAWGLGRFRRAIWSLVTHYMRMWDVTSARRVDHFIANSRFVAARIGKYYGREATVIAPPVDTRRFKASADRGDFYLVAGQLVGYKRVDLAVRACAELDRPLVVIGTGAELSRLRRLAGPRTRLLGWQEDAVLADHLARARALIFPGLEDFGIVPVEAMAAGTPVIAYGKGGAAETVVDGRTGVLFQTQTVEALQQAIVRFEAVEASFDPQDISRHAARFDRSEFTRAFADEIERLLSAGQAAMPRVRVVHPG